MFCPFPQDGAHTTINNLIKQFSQSYSFLSHWGINKQHSKWHLNPCLSSSCGLHPIPGAAEEEAGGGPGEAEEGCDGAQDHEGQLWAHRHCPPEHSPGWTEPGLWWGQVPGGEWTGFYFWSDFMTFVQCFDLIWTDWISYCYKLRFQILTSLYLMNCVPCVKMNRLKNLIL